MQPEIRTLSRKRHIDKWQTVNPGNLRSDLQRYYGDGVIQRINKKILLFPPINGAYSELFCGLSPDVTMEKSGSYGNAHPIIEIDKFKANGVL